MTITSSSRLLINENPLQVLPSLAVALKNLNEAVMLQQVQYWLSRSTKVFEGRRWVYNTIEEWNNQFPWLSERGVRDRFNSLIDKGVILTANFNKAKFDRTKWYSIDYDKLDSLLSTENSTQKPITTHSEETSGSRRKKVTNPSGRNLQMQSEESSALDSEETSGPIPETTRDYSEITQDICSSAHADEPVSQFKSKKITPTQIIEQEFEQLWAIYPRKVDKKKAFLGYKAWRKKSKDHTCAIMRKKLETYLKYIEINDLPMRFIQIGSTWFNGRFDDELDLTPQKSSDQRYKQIEPVRKVTDWKAYEAKWKAKRATSKSKPKLTKEERTKIFREFGSGSNKYR